MIDGDQCVDCGGWFPVDELVDEVCPDCRANNVDYGVDPDAGDDPDGDGEAYCWYCDSVTQHDEAGACVECGNGE